MRWLKLVRTEHFRGTCCTSFYWFLFLRPVDKSLFFFKSVENKIAQQTVSILCTFCICIGFLEYKT